MNPKIVNNLTKVNLTRKTNRRIDYIVLHYYGGLSSAINNSNYFKDVYRGASAHYFVDDQDIIRVVRDTDVAWSVGDKTVGALKSKVSNSNSINVEIRPYKIDPNSINSQDRDWYFTEQTLINTVDLVKYLMAEHNVPISKVIRHHDVTGKLCPRPFVGNDTNDYYKKTGNQLWLEFKKRLVNTIDGGDEEMTQEQFNAMMDKYNETLSKKAPGSWSEEARVWAESNGIIKGVQNGSMQYKKPLSKEEFVVALKNYHDKIK